MFESTFKYFHSTKVVVTRKFWQPIAGKLQFTGPLYVTALTDIFEWLLKEPLVAISLPDIWIAHWHSAL